MPPSDPILIGMTKIFPIHYQFLVFDPEVYIEPDLDQLWSKEQSKAGFFSSGTSMGFIGTYADSNLGILEVYTGLRKADPGESDMAFSMPIRCESGRLAFGGILDFDSAPFLTVELPPGDYTLFCSIFDLGENLDRAAWELPLEEITKRRKIERFRITLVEENVE